MGPWVVMALLATATPSVRTATAADPQTQSPQRVVERARNAFEYRDFDVVVTLTRPLVKRRDVPRAVLAEAYRLLAVGLHIMGDVAGARESFIFLLRMAPETRLDPFVIPPPVVETFNSVREQLELTRTPEPRPTPLPADPEIVLQVVEVPSPGVVWLPGGAAQLFILEDQTWWGVTWLTLQATGLVLNAIGYWNARGRPVGAVRDQWVALMYAGAGLAGASYAGSVIQGHVALDDAVDAVRREARSSPPIPSGPRASIGWTFGF